MAASYETTVQALRPVQPPGPAIQQAARTMRLADRHIRIECANSTEVTLVFPWTWRSFGEKLTMTMQDDSSVVIRSRCRIFTTLVDWGKNRLNITWASMHLKAALAGEAVETSGQVLRPPWADEYRPISALILGLTLLAAFFGHVCVTIAHRSYPFAVPFVVMAVVCCLAGVNAVACNRRWASLLQNAILAPTVVLYVLAVVNWPGGDDGPGMILVGMVGPMLLMATILAAFWTIRLLIRRER